MTGPDAESTAAPDPFGTAAIRAATIAAWTTSPTRFREDANLEEDHARGYYRDRVIIELAQNAADAAAATPSATAPAPSATATAPSSAGAAHPAGRLLLRLEPADGGGALLTAANTGAPLTSSGVQALASMRASAKHAPATPETAPSRGTVGRFGVGFAAVRAVSDEITIASAHGAVRFSAARSRALLTELLDKQRPANATAPVSAQTHASTALSQALDRPAADLPILRLPFALASAADPATEETVPPGYDTIVTARLRHPQERVLVARLLAEVDDVLLLALPALAEVRIEIDGEPPRTLTHVADRWLTVRAEGHHQPHDLADRPHEERTRTGWSITWAVPIPHGGGGGAPYPHRHVVHAPTPTDEPCTLPALLIATFPLDPSRRHVAPGPATDALVTRAGETYADLVERLVADGADPLPFVPLGLPAGRLDAGLHAAALAALRTRRVLTPITPTTPHLAERGVTRLIGPNEPSNPAFDGWGEPGGGAGGSGDAGLLAPRAAQAIAGPVGHDPRALAALAPALAGLVAIPPGPEAHARIRALGVDIRDLADAVDAMPLALASERWRDIYDALAPHASEPGVADALAGLPVPLADGRTVRGPRGLVILPSAERGVSRPIGPTEPINPAFGEVGGGAFAAVAGFAPFGLRVVHPDAAHPLLIRLGAAEATPRTLLAHPAIRAAVEAAAQDPHDSAPTAHATLALVQAALDAGATPREIGAAHPWLGALPLEADDGEPTPARDLTLPGSWAAAHLDALRPASPTLTEAHTPDALVAVGLRDTLAALTIRDVVAEPPLTGTDTDDAPESHLDGWPDYLDHLAGALGAGTYVGDLPAVADLDAVAEDAWPAALAHIAADQQTRAALLTSVRAGGREAPSYTAWWLRDLLGAPFAAPGATVPFLPPAPPEVGTDDAAARLGPEVLAALGAVGDLATLDAPAWGRYLDGLPPVGTPVSLDDALAIWRGLAALATRLNSTNADDGAAMDVDRVPVLRAGGGSDPVALIAPADDAAVAAEPMWAKVTDVIPAPPAAAETLADFLDVPLLLDPRIVVTGARATSTPPAVLALLPAAPATWWECDEIEVDGVQVAWWVAPPSGGHGSFEASATTTAGLARALAQAAHRWDVRSAIEILLTDPSRAAELTAEHAWDATP